MQIHKDSVSHASYENMAEEYDAVMDTKSFNAYYERPATLSLVPEVDGKYVLDAGCAAGFYTKWFLDHGAHVTAIDFSNNMIQMAKKRVATLIMADLNERFLF